MASVNRTIQTEQDRVMAARLIENRTLPFTLSLTDGKHRSTAQNRLQHMWMKEISEQLGDMTEHYARAYCKLTIGVPILRAQNEAFRLRYDEIIRPLPYEQKIAIMMEPLDFPVTRLMNVRQKTEYLEGIIRHFGEKGIVLTMPEEVRQELRMNRESENTNTDDADRPAASEEAEAGSIPASPVSASSSQYKLTRTDRSDLKDCARQFFGLTSDPALEPKVQRGLLEQSKDKWKAHLPPELHDHVKSLFLSADAVIKGDADRSAALAEVCGWLECEPEEIGA